jgi:hypothetical protein
VSAHIEQNPFPLMGMWNGILYRIDPDAPGGRVEVAPPKVLLRSVGSAIKPSPAIPAARLVDANREPMATQSRIDASTRAALLFKRDSSDTLRAGHPDLWALLVAGTSLDGCSFPPA